MSDIQQFILSLSPKERISLIAYIAASLENSEGEVGIDIPKRIVEESQKVFAAWDKREIETTSWKDLRSKLKNKYLNA